MLLPVNPKNQYKYVFSAGEILRLRFDLIICVNLFSKSSCEDNALIYATNTDAFIKSTRL